MADRILTWYLPEVTGDGTNQGASYCLDQSYVLPAKVRIYAHRAPQGEDLIVDIKDDGESIFGTHTISTIETHNENSEIEYSALAVSTFQVGETIDGGTSTASAQVISDYLGHLVIRMIKETAFTAAETITGATSLTTATVDAFVRGQLKPKWISTNSKYGAVLQASFNAEEEAGSFANDKTLMKQYSWITLDVVQSGGAKKITVQLELDHEYQEEKAEDED